MHNKAIVLCLANVVLTTSKLLHGDLQSSFERLGTQARQSRLYAAPPKCADPLKPKHIWNYCTVSWIPCIAPSPGLFSMSGQKRRWTLFTMLAFRITKENSFFPKSTKHRSQTCHRWPFTLFWQPGKCKVIPRHRKELRLEDRPVSPMGTDRAGCRRPCPAGFWISARMETPQHLWATCSCVWHPHSKNVSPYVHRIIAPLRLEKTSKIIKSNC